MYMVGQYFEEFLLHLLKKLQEQQQQQQQQQKKKLRELMKHIQC